MTIKYFFMILFTLVSISKFAQATAVPAQASTLPDRDLNNISWVFSGVLQNETGSHYGYYFILDKVNQLLHVQTAIIDLKTNVPMIVYEHKVDKKTLKKSINWSIGHAFISFNDVNSSWVLGLNDAKEGKFNFKIDMLKQADKQTKPSQLFKNIDFQARQSSRVNGTMTFKESHQEQFVTAEKSWYATITEIKNHIKKHEVSALFCALKNKQAFYVVQIPEQEAESATLSEWRDADGTLKKMSQFVSVLLSSNTMRIDIPIPKFHLNIIDGLSQLTGFNIIKAGHSTTNHQDFCFHINHEIIPKDAA